MSNKLLDQQTRKFIDVFFFGTPTFQDDILSLIEKKMSQSFSKESVTNDQLRCVAAYLEELMVCVGFQILGQNPSDEDLKFLIRRLPIERGAVLMREAGLQLLEKDPKELGALSRRLSSERSVILQT